MEGISQPVPHLGQTNSMTLIQKERAQKQHFFATSTLHSTADPYFPTLYWCILRTMVLGLLAFGYQLLLLYWELFFLWLDLQGIGSLRRTVTLCHASPRCLLPRIGSGMCKELVQMSFMRWKVLSLL